ncbi:MAG: hypothetical protein IKS41_02145 [Alphaproteobacteria bacterium]|nr:hypothetical protein [Alphaproteobacteria bacterium]
MNKIIHIITDILIILCSVILIFVIYNCIDAYLTDRRTTIAREENKIRQERHRFDVLKKAIFNDAFMNKCLTCMGDNGKPHIIENEKFSCEYTRKPTIDIPDHLKSGFCGDCLYVFTLESDVNNVWVDNVETCLQLLSKDKDTK